MRLVDPTFGARLRELRQARGLSLRELGAHAYVSKSMVSEWETGRRRPSLEIASMLDAALEAGGALAAMITETTPDAESADRIAHGIASPSLIDAGHVGALAGTLAGLRHLDDSLPTAALLPAVEGHLQTMEILARDARGSAARELRLVAVQYGQFAGWLNCQLRNDRRAETLLSVAARDALALGSPDLASQCHNFRGAVERRKGNARGIARWFMAAYETPGASALHKIDAGVQAVHGLGLLGDRRGAAALLSEADDLTEALPDDAASPVAYWLNPSWLRLSGGLAHLGIGNYRQAAESLRAGLGAMPDGWQAAEWSAEYRDALTQAETGA